MKTWLKRILNMPKKLLKKRVKKMDVVAEITSIEKPPRLGDYKIARAVHPEKELFRHL